MPEGAPSARPTPTPASRRHPPASSQICDSVSRRTRRRPPQPVELVPRRDGGAAGPSRASASHILAIYPNIISESVIHKVESSIQFSCPSHVSASRIRITDPSVLMQVAALAYPSLETFTRVRMLRLFHLASMFQARALCFSGSPLLCFSDWLPLSLPSSLALSVYPSLACSLARLLAPARPPSLPPLPLPSFNLSPASPPPLPLSLSPSLPRSLFLVLPLVFSYFLSLTHFIHFFPWHPNPSFPL